MDIEEILINDQITESLSDGVKDKRENLLALALTGKTKMYLGENLTPEQVKGLSNEDVIKKYDHYISSLGAKMSKNLSCSLVNLYSKTVNYFFPGTEEADLSYDLKNNPAIAETLSTISANLYIKFGVLLSPIIISLITLSHIKFKEKKG